MCPTIHMQTAQDFIVLTNNAHAKDVRKYRFITVGAERQIAYFLLAMRGVG